MKKAKRSTAIPPLQKGATDDEIIRWTAAHDVFDRVEAGVAEIVEDQSNLEQLLEDALVQGNSAQFNMRIPPVMKAIPKSTPCRRVWTSRGFNTRMSIGKG